MTMTEYPSGYGRRDQPPECVPMDGRLDCPCCDGHAEHAYGAGMDADATTCVTCEGWGYFEVTIPLPEYPPASS